MDITPNTNIKLLKGVPLDNTYTNTLFFESVEAQTAYFSSLMKHNLTNYTYQRVNKGVMKVALCSDSCYDCNYLMFQNTSFGNKWFYAFINSVEYINNETCQISYEIDVMQTWFYFCTLKESFVEREHDEKDIVGENTTPENVPLGEYTTAIVQQKIYKDLCVWVQLVPSNKDEESHGHLYGKIFSGLETYMIPKTDGDYEGSINNVINQFIIDDKKEVVGAFLAPNEFATADTYTKYETAITRGTTLDGYFPRNNKLLTYPYTFCEVSSSSGEKCEYKFENKGYTNTFRIYHTTLNQPNAMVTMDGYNGYTKNTLDTVSLNCFPMCSYSDNSLLNYYATQAQADATKSLLALGTTGVASAASGNPLPIVGGVINTVNKLADISTMKREPQKIKGNTNENNILANNDLIGFTFAKKTIKEEYARKIDEYFDLYGYATYRVKKPNISSRPVWNYVKTNGCNIAGSIPADDMKKIKSVFDNGVTFWKNGNEVGNYNLDNSPS